MFSTAHVCYYLLYIRLTNYSAKAYQLTYRKCDYMYVKNNELLPLRSATKSQRVRVTI